MNNIIFRFLFIILSAFVSVCLYNSIECLFVFLAALLKIYFTLLVFAKQQMTAALCHKEVAIFTIILLHVYLHAFRATSNLRTCMHVLHLHQ